VIPADPGEIRAEIGVCRQVNAQTIDCQHPTWLGGHQIVKLDRTTKPAQLRVMFPGDLSCRR
jgi:predicted RNA-binding protein with PUA domain